MYNYRVIIDTTVEIQRMNLHATKEVWEKVTDFYSTEEACTFIRFLAKQDCISPMRANEMLSFME